MLTYRVLARLLSYPDGDLVGSIPECRRLLAREAVLESEQPRSLNRLMEEIEAGDLIDLQERYVGLFDRVRSLSLHLFEHVHGDSRDRGTAMVDLIAHYRKHGLEMTPRELPDHLPLFLEFLSTLSPEAARPLLIDTSHILAAIRDRLGARKSHYAGIFDALLFLAGTNVDPQPVADIGEDSFEALDRAWEDTPVTFGPESLAGAPGAGGCQRAATILARMNTI